MFYRNTLTLIIVVSLLACDVNLAIAGTRQKLFVAEQIKGSVYVIDTDTLQILSSLPRETAGAMTFTEHQDKLYFINALFVNIVDKFTLANMSSFLYDGFATPGLTKARITSDGKKLYIGVVGWGKADTSGIYEIDLNSRSQTKIIDENSINSGLLDISPEGTILYYPSITCITVLDTKTDSVLQTLPLKSEEFVRDIVCGAKDILYASLYFYPSNPERKPKIIMINLSNKTQKYLEVNSVIHRLLYAPDRNLYALGEGVIYQIDAQDLTLMNSFPLSGRDLAMTADGKILFISSPDTSEIIAISPTDGSVIKKIKVGEFPYALFIF